MARRLRFHPPGALVEVTCRTVQGRLLLSPDRGIADLCRGVLARAARLYPVQIHAFVFLGNHYHLLLTAPNAQRLASFMNYLNSNLAREVGRSVGWREKFWGHRYRSILVSDEEGAQVERLRYILSHGCKENLVRRPSEWPGAHAVDSLLTGVTISGSWIDRTRQRRSRRTDRSGSRVDFSSREVLQLTPLPCWSHLARERYQERVREMVREIERATERRLAEQGRWPSGSSRLVIRDRRRDRFRIRRRPAPLVHAASRSVRAAFRDEYRRFVTAYRFAAARLRESAEGLELVALFPHGCFPPPAPFVAIPVRSSP